MMMTPQDDAIHRADTCTRESVLEVELIHVYYYDGIRRKVFLCPTTGKVLICEEREGEWHEVD